MSHIRFIAIMPQNVQPGDKVRLKGRVVDQAEVFSINFVNDTCNHPEDITYHFKWLIGEDKIVQDYKQNGEWMNPIETDYTLDEGKFALEFAFQEDSIYVYYIYGDGSNYISSYELAFDLSEIRALQVWGDVDKVTELTYAYPQ